ncbi:MAG: ABC transporter ATP-binding protein, partial [Lachnospiraceae bacterium]|nr:ABC transporter ATP-binding protein [Lachnospiraceae bacterium]
MPINSFKDDEQTVNESGKIKTLLRLFAYLFTYKKEIALVLFIMMICVGITLLNPLIIETAIDDYISQSNWNGLCKLCAFAFLLNIFMVMLIKLRMHIMNKVCNSILVTIRQELYTHIQTLDFHFFDSRPTGKILSRIIGDINSLKDVLGNSVTTLIPDFITITGVVVIMVLKNPKLTLASLCSTPLLLLGMWIIQTYSHKRWQIFRKKSANLNAFLHENIAGMRIIQSFTAEEETTETFHQLVKEHRIAFNNAVRMNDAFGSIIDFCWGIGCVAMYYTGIVIIGVQTVSVGTLLAFGNYINMFWRPISNLSSFYNQLITNIAAAERIFEILDTPSEIAEGEASTVLPPIEGRVSFKEVTFAYSDAPDIKVLDKVSFDIKPGETIALVGPTGAGKTTIVNLISRFYDATEGHVLIDGHDVKDVTVHSLRSQMGIMTQDNFLFSGTVKENIRYGKLDATDDEIIAAAKAVNAH